MQEPSKFEARTQSPFTRCRCILRPGKVCGLYLFDGTLVLENGCVPTKWTGRFQTFHITVGLLHFANINNRMIHADIAMRGDSGAFIETATPRSVTESGGSHQHTIIMFPSSVVLWY